MSKVVVEIGLVALNVVEGDQLTGRVIGASLLCSGCPFARLACKLVVLVPQPFAEPIRAPLLKRVSVLGEELGGVSPNIRPGEPLDYLDEVFEGVAGRSNIGRATDQLVPIEGAGRVGLLDPAQGEMAVVEGGDGLHQRSLPAINLAAFDFASLPLASLARISAGGFNCGHRQVVFGQQALNVTSGQRCLCFACTSLGR